MRIAHLISLLFTLLLVACGGGSGSGSGSGSTSSSTTTPSEVFSFRAVTDEDLNRVKTTWAQRDLSAKEVSLAYEDSQPNYHIRIYKHKVGSNFHFGAVITPSAILTKPLPVVVTVDGLNQANPSMTMDNSLRDYKSDSVLVVPAFRGRYLRYKNQNFFAEGDFCDAYDCATDDTIALMNVVEATEPRAKMDKILVMGYSRGGNVALLLGERDKRVDTVVAGASPVDFYRQQVRDRYGSQYTCQFFTGKTIDQTRERILASSPLHFAILPSVNKVHLFQGGSDDVVPPWNGQEMNDRLISQKANVSFYLYNGYGHGDIWQNQNFVNTWQQLTSEFIASH